MAPVIHLYQGDNLQIMRGLSDDAEVGGRVRLVYIDPPYGTGRDFRVSGSRRATVSSERAGKTAYRDRLRGGPYLDFLRPRLEMLRELMADDGSIYVHVDVKAGHHVKVLMDEIFGAANFRNDITRIKCNPKNFSRKSFGNVKDMVLFYTKGAKYVWNQPREAFTGDEIERLFPKVDKDGRRYTTTPLHAPGETRNGPSGAEWKGMAPPAGRHWRCKPEQLDRLDRAGLIEWSRTGNPRKKLFADEAAPAGKFRQDVWTFKDPQYPRYPTEKNLTMLKMIVTASSNPGDLVLDCFCGSGAALAAARELGRQWIGIDRSEVAIRICRERLGME